jgi:2-C-methyl-D-erythritol 2,4-cyclodiphosphate synthase/2-C-methyl-D-erythritol 4-phosphate cytidylyltransferase
LRRLLGETRIERVVVVLAADDHRWASVAQRLADPVGNQRLVTTQGGPSRQVSVRNGLDALANQANANDWVMVHDAARPCLSEAELDALFAALEKGGDACAGAILAAPVTDTVKRELAEHVETLDRQGLWRALTPQVFRFGPLCRAIDEATRVGVTITDESQAMERLGVYPILVAGSPFNIKVTRVEDLSIAAQVLSVSEGSCVAANESRMRVGQGFDVHAFGEGRYVMLGGVRIDYARGVVAHSDGDVVIHALCDALLGALGQGDIGQHFPDSDPRYAGADSRSFLREVAARVRAAGLVLLNADITVLAEAPRIAPHRAAMAALLAADLAADSARINIKATTTERLGFVGRGEGLAALAVAMLGPR